MSFNLSELGAAFSAGGALVQMAQGADRQKREERAAAFDSAINAVDRGLAVADDAYLRVTQGQPVDYQSIANRIEGELRQARLFLDPLRASALITPIAGLGAWADHRKGRRRDGRGLGFMAPMTSAFGPGAGGQFGPTTVFTPQGMTTPSPGMPNSVGRSIAPQINQLRAALRGIRQRLVAARAKVHSFTAFSGLGDPAPQGAYTGLLKLVTASAAAYHGYKRTGTVGNALLWAAAPVLLSPVAGVITVGIAMGQGFGKAKSGPQAV